MANRAALNDYVFDIGFYRVKDRIELNLFSAIFSIYIVLVLAKYTIRNIVLIRRS